jgi:hypothetical protein
VSLSLISAVFAATNRFASDQLGSSEAVEMKLNLPSTIFLSRFSSPRFGMTRLRSRG